MESGLHIFLGIPHSTAELQMMDQSPNAAHKSEYQWRKEEFFYKHMGQPISKDKAISMFVSAAKAALTKRNIKAGWKKVGFLPFAPPVMKCKAPLIRHKPTEEDKVQNSEIVDDDTSD